MIVKNKKKKEKIKQEREKGFVKEIVVIYIVVLILAYFGIDLQTAAKYIESFFQNLVNLF